MQFLFFFKTNKQNNIIEPENVNVTSSLFIFENSGLLCGFVALTQFLLCVFLTVNTDCCRDFADNFMLLLGCFYPFSGLNNAILLCCLHDAHSQQKQTPHLMDSLSYYCRTQGTQVFKSSFQLCAHLEFFFRRSFESCCDRDMIHTHQSLEDQTLSIETLYVFIYHVWHLSTSNSSLTSLTGTPDLE